MTPAPPRRTGQQRTVGTADVAMGAGLLPLVAAIVSLAIAPRLFWPLLGIAAGLWLVGLAAARGETRSRDIARPNRPPTAQTRRSQDRRGGHAAAA